MAFLVEQGQDAVFLESCRTARAALMDRLEEDASKQLIHRDAADVGYEGS